MQAQDIMQEVHTLKLSPEQTVYEAICVINSEAHPALPTYGAVILDEQHKLIGIISIKDIIRATLPEYLCQNLSEFSWGGMLEEQAAKVRNLAVQEIMSTELITVEADTSVMHCADLMINKRLQRLPVLESSGKILGIVHINNIYQAISQLLCTLEH